MRVIRLQHLSTAVADRLSAGRGLRDADWPFRVDPPRDSLYSGIAGRTGAGIMLEKATNAEWAGSEPKVATPLDLVQGSGH
jgi:hypothetical protein